MFSSEKFNNHTPVIESWPSSEARDIARMPSNTFQTMTSATSFTEAWSTDSLDFTYDNKMLNPCNSRAYLFPDNPNSMRARPGLYEDYTSINKRVKRQQIKDLKTQIARLKETI